MKQWSLVLILLKTTGKKNPQEIKRAEIYYDKDGYKDNLTVAGIMQCVYQLTFVSNKMLL